MSKTESKETVSLWQNGFKTKFVSKVIIKRDCCKMLNFDERISRLLMVYLTHLVRCNRIDLFLPDAKPAFYVLQVF